MLNGPPKKNEVIKIPTPEIQKKPEAKNTVPEKSKEEIEHEQRTKELQSHKNNISRLDRIQELRGSLGGGTEQETERIQKELTTAKQESDVLEGSAVDIKKLDTSMLNDARYIDHVEQALSAQKKSEAAKSPDQLGREYWQSQADKAKSDIELYENEMTLDEAAFNEKYGTLAEYMRGVIPGMIEKKKKTMEDSEKQAQYGLEQ